MNELLLALFLIPLVAVCDHVRGGWQLFGADENVRLMFKFLYGFLLSVLLVNDLLLPAFACAALWWLGEKPGWGYPMGQALLGTFRQAEQFPDARPEKWQEWLHVKNCWWSLAIRGAIWGIPCLPLMYFDWRYGLLPCFMALAMPLAAYIGRIAGADNRINELSRGAIMGLLAWLV